MIIFFFFIIYSANYFFFLGGSVVSKYENCTHAVCAYDLSARPFTNTYILDELPRELNPSVKHVSREVQKKKNLFYLQKYFNIKI